jgi:hypothetical protein
MNGSLTRSAIGCAIACGAFIVGPSLVGATAANADLLGVGGGGGGVDVLGVDVLGGGGKTKSVNGSQNRVSAVSTAPSTRSVVIRSKDSATPPAGETAQAPAIVPAAYTPPTMMGSPLVDAIPAAPPASVTPPPAAVPLAGGLLPLPAAPAFGPPAPRALPVIPSTSAPSPGRPLAPADSLRPPTKIPDTFRVGYSEYLRSATNMDILAAALPGVAGIAGFTLLGAFAGYRQAVGLQKALLAPVPTRIVL